MACGKIHTIASVEVKGDGSNDGTNNGSHYELYAFGSNSDGQLGVGRKTEYSERPVRLEQAARIVNDGNNADHSKTSSPPPAPRLAAGSSHSMALCPASGK